MTTISSKALAFINPASDFKSFEEVENIIASPDCYTLCLVSTFDFVKNRINEIISSNVQGDILLAGVWRGGLAAYIQALLIENNQMHRKLFLADTFAGFLEIKGDYENDKKMLEYFKTLSAPSGSISDVEKLFRNLNLPLGNVYFLEGDVKKTTETFNNKLSFLLIDVDFYEPTFDALTNLYKNISKDGYVYVDDYSVSDFDCKQSVDDFLRINNKNPQIEKVNNFAVFWKV